MTVGDLRAALADPRLTDDSEVLVQAREPATHDCGCHNCCAEIDVGLSEAGLIECGKRALVLIPPEALRSYGTRGIGGDSEEDENDGQ